MKEEKLLTQRHTDIEIERQSPEYVRNIISSLKQFRRGKHLKGLSIKEMIEEGRR